MLTTIYTKTIALNAKHILNYWVRVYIKKRLVGCHCHMRVGDLYPNAVGSGL
jgi:hypothetical protein